MTANEELPGGLHYDGTGRDVQVGPSTGIIRYYPVSTTASAKPPARTSVWLHLVAALAGVLGACLAVSAGGYGSEQAQPNGLIALGAAGVLAGAVVAGGRLSPAMPLAAGVTSLGVLALTLVRPEVLPGLQAAGPAACFAGVFLVVAALRWSR